jgi:hypothetical protein
LSGNAATFILNRDTNKAKLNLTTTMDGYAPRMKVRLYLEAGGR